MKTRQEGSQNRLDNDKKVAPLEQQSAKPEPQKKTRFPGGRFGLSVVGFVAVNLAILWGVKSADWSFPGGSLDKDVVGDNLKQSPSYGTWSWWAARAFFREPKTPDVVMMGSSLINSACWSADAATTKKDIDCTEHHHVVTMENLLKNKLGGATPSVLNMAVQGAGACDYYMMTRGLFEGDRKPKVLVLGLAPRDFIDNKMSNLGSTEPFMFYERYVPFDDTVARAYSDPISRTLGAIEWKVLHMPLRRFHAAVAGYFMDDSTIEKPRAAAGDQLRNALCTSTLRIFPGDIVVPARLQEGCFDNTSEYASRYKNPHPEHFKTQLFFFEEMLKRMHEQNIQVLVVDMPTLMRNRAMLPISFWVEYTTKMESICAKQHAQYLFLSASEDYNKMDFVDTVHVNFRGGAKVLNRIAEELATRPQLASVLQSSQDQMISSKKIQPAN